MVLFSLNSCATADVESVPQSERSEAITLSEGDVLQFQFFNNPELNQTQTVRPDGKISLPLIYDVEVRGRTVPDLRESLVEMYEPHLKYPEVNVVVQSLHSNRVYVAGEVNSPGYVEMTGRLTAIEAIMSAGGYNTETAKMQSVILVRHTENSRKGYRLDLREALTGKENHTLQMEPYDILFVPQKTIARVNLWIDQYIDQAIPQAVLSTIPFVVYREYFNQ
jgi:protein involved in polysaccharide export with SLBB domain